MGKKGKDKKKGKGAEKTAAKTDKKLSNKMKKELKLMGEDDIENILAQIDKEEKKRTQITEAVVEPPTRRANFTFVAHPDKDQLILYGGEYFNGQKTVVYNDLFFYNIQNNTWTVLKDPGAPPPRCAHQAVVTSANKGQLWVFGGEFASPSQSQFYHYRDLWVFHLHGKRWEKITAPNGPSARSGHRMVYSKKQLIVFGGFHDNLRSYKYFNDVYSFNTETYKWTKIEPSGTGPSARSGCCMAALNDGRVLVYGGYSKTTVKGDCEKGQVHTDAFLLVPDKNDTTGTKYKWVQTKIGGLGFSPRSGMSLVPTANNAAAYFHGGVFDVVDDEEDLAGNFFDDLYYLDLEKLAWKNVTLSGKKDKEPKVRRRKNKDTWDAQESDEEMELDDKEQSAIPEEPKTTTIADDGIFKVTIGPTPSVSGSTVATTDTEQATHFRPSPRMKSGLAIKHGILYLYGGIFEDGDRHVTLSDLYALDLKKLDEWRVILKDNAAAQEWVSSDSDSEESDDDDEGDDDSEEDEESDESMES